MSSDNYPAIIQPAFERTSLGYRQTEINKEFFALCGTIVLCIPPAEEAAFTVMDALDAIAEPTKTHYRPEESGEFQMPQTD